MNSEKKKDTHTEGEKLLKQTQEDQLKGLIWRSFRTLLKNSISQGKNGTIFYLVLLSRIGLQVDGP